LDFLFNVTVLNIHKRTLAGSLIIFKKKYENNDLHYSLNNLNYIISRYLTVLILLFIVIFVIFSKHH